MRGKGLISYKLIHGGEDHPRLCGEKIIAENFAGGTAGSPPPMRGKVAFNFRHTV